MQQCRVIGNCSIITILKESIYGDSMGFLLVAKRFGDAVFVRFVVRA